MIANKQYRQGVNTIDLILVFMVGLLSLFITQGWENRLADVFFTLTWVIVCIYAIALSGVFKNLILRTPTWTISFLISIPIWLLVNLIPIPSSTGLELDAKSPLVEVVGEGLVNNITQGFYIPFVETIIIVGFITVFLLRQTKDNSPRVISGFGKNAQRNKTFGFLLIFIALFGAIVHYAVGLALLNSGVSFDFFLLHQIISFFIFAFIGISPLGLGGAIASHISKNSLVLLATTGSIGFMFSMFVLCVILDIIAVKTNKKENTHQRLIKNVGLNV